MKLDAMLNDLCGPWDVVEVLRILAFRWGIGSEKSESLCESVDSLEEGSLVPLP
jgi:hypothetical protein